MSPEIIGLIGLVVLLILLFTGLYISATMAIVGFVGIFLISGFSAFSTLYIVPVGLLKDSNFAVMPLFVLMSEFIAMVGIGTEAFTVARAWVGPLRGGLAMAAVGGCGLFAATSGSSTACAIVMGKIAYPEMKRFKYAATLASGCLCGGRLLRCDDPAQHALCHDWNINRRFHWQIIHGRYFTRSNSNNFLFHRHLYYVQIQSKPRPSCTKLTL